MNMNNKNAAATGARTAAAGNFKFIPVPQEARRYSPINHSAGQYQHAYMYM